MKYFTLTLSSRKLSADVKNHEIIFKCHKPFQSGFLENI